MSVALARAPLIAVKASVLASSTVKVTSPFVPARRVFKGLRIAAQSGVN